MKAWLWAGVFACLMVLMTGSLVSCGSGGKPEVEQPMDQEGLFVMDFQPAGQLPTAVKYPAIYVQFSKPVVSVAKLGQPSNTSDLRKIDPPLEGVFRWYGTSLLSFDASEGVIPQREYTVTLSDDIVSVDGSQRGTTWQATPGLFAYRRSIAKDVLGTDDPAEVQTYLSDWDKFNDVAAKAAAKGYKMLSGFDDAYRTFSNNVSAPWVTGTTVTVDENLMKWVDQTKEYTDKGYNNKSSLWDSQWASDQGPTGKVFGFFYSTWGINFTLLGNSLETPTAEGGKEEVGNGIYGDYAVCEGPQPYYWGGTWICGAAGSDNLETIKDVMLKLTCDEAIMKQITMDTQDYTNNEKAMNEIASSDYKSDFLGGQNHIALFAEAATKIDMSNAGPYDQGLNESFQNAFKDYFTGNVEEDAAKANFETAIKEKYPELTDVVWPA